MAILQQLLGMPGGAAGAPGGRPGAFPGLFDFPPAGGGAGATTGMPSMFGGQKKNTDAFFTDRLPILQKVKRPVLAVFFAFCLWRGWVGRWGCLQGLMSNSYFDMCAVPLRCLPGSPLFGRAFFVAQTWVDLGLRLVGFLINLARGKAKLPSREDLFTPPSGAAAPPWAVPGGFGAQGSPQQQTPVGMPTARTTAVPAQTAPQPSAGGVSPQQRPQTPASQGKPGRTVPPIIDADVTFLD